MFTEHFHLYFNTTECPKPGDISVLKWQIIEIVHGQNNIIALSSMECYQLLNIYNTTSYTIVQIILTSRMQN